MSGQIESREDLEDALDALREEVDRVDEFEELLKSNLNGAFTRISDFDDRLTRIEHRLDELEDEVKVASATTSDNKRGKLKKAIDIIHFAADGKRHGPSGVAVDTGEVTAAANCSRSRALTLMDEIAGCQEWATTESPGGPKPKQIRIRFDGRDVDALVDDLVDEWGENS